jgi:hypothetical protein
MPFKDDGEMCMDDHECKMASKCWYPQSQHVVNGTMQCMKAYGLSDGSSIGYKELFHKNMKHDNFLSNGRVCASMFAVPTGTNEGRCSSFSSSDSRDCTPFYERNGINYNNKCTYNYN